MRIRRNQMAISEAELSAMTADLDEVHQATLPAMRASAAEWAATEGAAERRRLSRRGFLATGSLAVVGGALLAACGSSAHSASGNASTTKPSSGSSGVPTDVQVAAMAASLEILGVQTYMAGIQAAQAGKLGSVPPALVTFAQTAMKQHQDHAAAWNAILGSAGYQKVTAPDAALQPTVNQLFAKVTDVPGLAGLALQVEDIAAATYLNGIPALSSAKAVETAATIQPVEMQHAAILNFVLGKYPVPDSFAQTTGARPPTDVPAPAKA